MNFLPSRSIPLWFALLGALLLPSQRITAAIASGAKLRIDPKK